MIATILFALVTACGSSEGDGDRPRAGSCRDIAEVCIQNECERQINASMDPERFTTLCAIESCGAEGNPDDFDESVFLNTPASDAARWAICFYDGDDTAECNEAAMACEG